MMAFSMTNIAAFIALFHVSMMVATMTPYQNCDSLNVSPLAPETTLLELEPAAAPIAGSPETVPCKTCGLPDLSPPAPEADSPEQAPTPPIGSPRKAPPCKTCGSRNLSPPAPEANSHEQASTPPVGALRKPPPCETCGSHNLSPPTPEANSPELAPTPPVGHPRKTPTCKTCGSRNLSPPVPKANSPEQAPTPPVGHPRKAPTCKTCGSRNQSPPAPKANSPEQAPTPPPGSPSTVPPKTAPTPPVGSPETSKEPKDGVFDVTEHGAVADGGAESSSAFSAAWTAACNHPGNSTFYIPEGRFLVGPIIFSGPCHNNQSPNIKIRGTLVAPSSLNAFQSSASWIAFKTLQGLTLTGGTKTAKLDGQGAEEAWKQPSCKKSATCKKLITSIAFINVSHATISSITLSNSKSFHLGLHGSNNININNINIIAPWDSPNTDGIHVSQSSNIKISSSTIGVGDDCVSIGPGSRNISVSNVQCGPGHGISVGSLGKYKNEKDVAGVRVRNCTIKGTQNGVRVKTWPGSPASNASNISFQDIYMINVSNPIIIDQEYCPSNSCNITDPSLVKLTNIFMRNINGTYNTKSAVILHCSSGVACQNIRLVNINLNYVGPNNTRHVGGLSMKGFLNGLQVFNSRF